MKKLIYASNDYSRAIADETGKVIYYQSHGSDLSFMLKALAKELNLKFDYKTLPPTDFGDLPKKISPS